MVWLPFFYFPINIGLLIIPIDVHIFQRGGPTTNQKLISHVLDQIGHHSHHRSTQRIIIPCFMDDPDGIIIRQSDRKIYGEKLKPGDTIDFPMLILLGLSGDYSVSLHQSIDMPVEYKIIIWFYKKRNNIIGLSSIIPFKQQIRSSSHWKATTKAFRAALMWRALRPGSWTLLPGGGPTGEGGGLREMEMEMGHSGESYLRAVFKTPVGRWLVRGLYNPIVIGDYNNPIEQSL